MDITKDTNYISTARPIRPRPFNAFYSYPKCFVLLFRKFLISRTDFFVRFWPNPVWVTTLSLRTIFSDVSLVEFVWRAEVVRGEEADRDSAFPNGEGSVVRLSTGIASTVPRPNHAFPRDRSSD